MSAVYFYIAGKGEANAGIFFDAIQFVTCWSAMYINGISAFHKIEWQAIRRVIIHESYENLFGGLKDKIEKVLILPQFFFSSHKYPDGEARV